MNLLTQGICKFFYICSYLKFRKMSGYNWQEIFKLKTEKELIQIYSGKSSLKINKLSPY